MANRKASPGASAREPAEAADSGPSFEEALERLETIVEELEAGSLSLEESIAHYEEGIRLSRRLTQTLDQAEKRIERLIESEEPGGVPRTEPMEFDERSNDAPAEPQAQGRAPAGPSARVSGRAPTIPESDELPF